MVQYVSEEEQREFSAPRSLLHLSEIVQVVGERQMSWLHFSHPNSPSQCFPPLLVNFFPPPFLSLPFRLISDCSFFSSQHTTLLPLLQAFFNDKYMQEHPEDLEKIEKLKDLIAWQVRLKLIMRTIVLMHHTVVCKVVYLIKYISVQGKVSGAAYYKLHAWLT